MSKLSFCNRKEEDLLSNNSNLQTAKNEKNDEFYTMISDVESELSRYDFTDKIIYCPCDTVLSAFTRYLFINYKKLKLRGLITTGLGIGIIRYKGIILPISSVSCFSREVESAFKLADIIITNPPFSKFREFMNLITKSEKQFLVLGNLNAAKYKELFPLVKEGKMWLGYNHGTMSFKVPNIFSRNNVYVKDNERLAKFGNICWFTNLKRTFKSLKLTQKYDPLRYQKYDTYDAIDVPKVKDIPYDYYDIMGVPITFLQYYDPLQFDIIGEINHGCDNEYDVAKPTVKGKELFPRILIRRKK